MIVEGASKSGNRLHKKIWKLIKESILSTEGGKERFNHDIITWVVRNFINFKLNTVQSSILSSTNSHSAFYGERQNGKTIGGILFAWYYAEHGMKSVFISPNINMSNYAYEKAKSMMPDTPNGLWGPRGLRYRNNGVMKFSSDPEDTKNSDIVVVDELDYFSNMANKNKRASRVLVIGHRQDDGMLSNLVYDKLWQPYD